ncbi:MAG: hypothetical protein HEQ20_25340 [Aphanizomenon flos-aquae KM1D3_PB]|uniref:hypothetical protein n=1 Tax=Aphanizomenon flos-aquae TaxID=1176 RepID=UPI00190FAD0D|nr:hypothetical protein [Aphanizomenon flos-aquae]QSV69399.1 MAG: hypothetical protein HEQ20_25340 [Aphanizomenon flos-aquae KM1D3_PB]
MKIVVIARQEARVKKFSAILRFFTQFGFIVFTYLILLREFTWFSVRVLIIFSSPKSVNKYVWRFLGIFMTQHKNNQF